jgi:hypothetical protein
VRSTRSVPAVTRPSLVFALLAPSRHRGISDQTSRHLGQNVRAWGRHRSSRQVATTVSGWPTGWCRWPGRSRWASDGEPTDGQLYVNLRDTRAPRRYGRSMRSAASCERSAYRGAGSRRRRRGHGPRWRSSVPMRRAYVCARATRPPRLVRRGPCMRSVSNWRAGPDGPDGFPTPTTTRRPRATGRGGVCGRDPSPAHRIRVRRGPVSAG